MLILLHYYSFIFLHNFLIDFHSILLHTVVLKPPYLMYHFHWHFSHKILCSFKTPFLYEAHIHTHFFYTNEWIESYIHSKCSLCFSKVIFPIFCSVFLLTQKFFTDLLPNNSIMKTFFYGYKTFHGVPVLLSLWWSFIFIIRLILCQCYKSMLTWRRSNCAWFCPQGSPRHVQIFLWRSHTIGLHRGQGCSKHPTVHRTDLHIHKQ